MTISLADAGESVFWMVNKNGDQGVLNEIARGVVNIRRIEQHWEYMLRKEKFLKPPVDKICLAPYVCSVDIRKLAKNIRQY